MANKKTLLNIINSTLIVAIIAFGFGVLLIGIVHCHPNAEDFSLTSAPLREGLFSSIKNLLIAYDGRYFTNLLHGLNPLGMGFLHGYQASIFFAIVFTSSSVFYFVKSLFPLLYSWKILMFSILFVLINFALSPSIVHQLFWLVSSIVYLYGCCFYLLWVGSFFRYLNSVKPKMKKLYFFLSSLLLIGSIGINEMFLILNFLTLLAFFLYFLYTKSAEIKSFGSVLLTGIISIGFFLSNPGIKQRFNSFGAERADMNLLSLIYNSITDYLIVSLSSLLSGVLLLSFTLLVLANTKSSKLRFSSNMVAKKPIIFLFGIFICLYLSTFAFYIPMGFEAATPHRIFTSIVLIQQLAIILLIPTILSYYLPHIVKQIRSRKQLFSLFGLSMIFISLTLLNNNLTSIRNDYKAGALDAFNETMEIRYAIISEAKASNKCWKQASLPPLINPPKSIFSPPDIQTNKEAIYWNNAYENYFLIDEVRLVGDTIFDQHLITDTP